MGGQASEHSQVQAAQVQHAAVQVLLRCVQLGKVQEVVVDIVVCDLLGGDSRPPGDPEDGCQQLQHLGAQLHSLRGGIAKAAGPLVEAAHTAGLSAGGALLQQLQQHSLGRVDQEPKGCLHGSLARQGLRPAIILVAAQLLLGPPVVAAAA